MLKAFKKLKPLSEFSQEGQALVKAMKSCSENRHFLVHGAGMSFDEKTDEIKIRKHDFKSKIPMVITVRAPVSELEPLGDYLLALVKELHAFSKKLDEKFPHTQAHHEVHSRETHV